MKVAMKSDLKRKWVENLRSGRFEQGVGALNAAVGLCCLGVLCESAIELGMDVSRFDKNSRECDYSVCGVPQGGTVLEYETREMFGLSREDMDSLWRMNDGFGGSCSKSFDEIADWIEENVEEDEDVVE